MSRAVLEVGAATPDASARSVALAVLRTGPVSRAELARQLDLSTPSLTRLTRPMLASGLLVEGDAELVSRTGRPARPLDIDPEHAFFVGIKLTDSVAYTVVTDLKGEEIGREERPVTDPSPDGIVALITAISRDHRADRPRVAGLGVALGGTVEGHRLVRRAPFLGWGEVPLAERLEQATDLPVSVDNDVRALAQAEHWFGAGRGCDSLVVITVGVGTGCAVVIQDRLLEGRHGLAAIIGHWVLDPDGPDCFEADHRGCAAAVLTSGAISDLATRRLGRPVSFDQCVGLAAAGDPVAEEIVRYAAGHLGLLTARVADLIAPERILITGDGVGFVDVAEDTFRAALRRHRTGEADDDEVVIDHSDFYDWARGAAAVAIRRYVLTDLAVS